MSNKSDTSTQSFSTNVDSRSYQTNQNDRDGADDYEEYLIATKGNKNENISDGALDCGVHPKDVINYTNNVPINLAGNNNPNQENPSGLILTKGVDPMKMVTQHMNLNSYGPEVKKCMQDVVTKIQSQNKNALKAKNKTDKKSTQKNSQTAGKDSFKFDHANVFIILAVMVLIALIGAVVFHIINSKKE